MKFSELTSRAHFRGLWPPNPSSQSPPTLIFDRSWIILGNGEKTWHVPSLQVIRFCPGSLSNFSNLDFLRQVRSTLQWANGRNLTLEKVFSVEIDPIKYWGANRKPMAASSNFRFPPYFYFRFGLKRPSRGIFGRFWPFLRTIMPDNSNQVNCTKWALVQCSVLSGPKWCRTLF